MRFTAIAAALAVLSANNADAQHSRQLNDLNWIEVEELVPMRIQTVLLPVGTLEAHGVGPNGADNLVPEALADYLAQELDALIAPTIPYGVNTSLDEYAGTFGISAEVMRELARQVFGGLAATGFVNIIVLNGHGPNFTPLNDAAIDVFRETDARILVINWWSATAHITEEVFGEQGGHAGNAFSNAWRAYPFPTAIVLYRAGEGYLDFDRGKAERYFERVRQEVLAIVRDVLGKWEGQRPLTRAPRQARGLD